MTASATPPATPATDSDIKRARELAIGLAVLYLLLGVAGVVLSVYAPVWGIDTDTIQVFGLGMLFAAGGVKVGQGHIHDSDVLTKDGFALVLTSLTMLGGALTFTTSILKL